MKKMVAILIVGLCGLATELHSMGAAGGRMSTRLLRAVRQPQVALRLESAVGASKPQGRGMNFGMNPRAAARPQGFTQGLSKEVGRRWFSSQAGLRVNPTTVSMSLSPPMAGKLQSMLPSKTSKMFWHYYEAFDKMLTGYSFTYPEAKLVKMYWQMKLCLLDLAGLSNIVESVKEGESKLRSLEWFNEYYSSLISKDYPVKQKENLSHLFGILSENLNGDLSDDYVTNVLNGEVREGLIEDQVPYIKAYQSLSNLIDPIQMTQQIRLLGSDLLELLSKLITSIQESFTQSGSSYIVTPNEEKILIGSPDDYQVRGLTDAL
ncbi:hypothetical protein HOM50_04445 [bacterium]|jgi:hypothetical protein|nr:hypothetical protein [bacterium]MBT5015629.1 hypothetical protein [bacterium]